jgi:hypothetical protein
VPDRPTIKRPDTSQPHRYEHRRPHRPSHLPKRLTPPPERSGPPDLTLFLYVGIALALVLVVVAIPYLIGFLFEVVRI